MDDSPVVMARQLRIDLWVFVPETDEMPSAREVADGMVEGLGDAWFELDDGDAHAISYTWHADYVGPTQIVKLDNEDQ